MGGVWTQVFYTHWDGIGLLGLSYTKGTHNSIRHPTYNLTGTSQLALRLYFTSYLILRFINTAL